jgi:urease accessory protein
MTAALPTARAHRHHGDANDSVALTYDDRFLRRKVLTTVSGLRVLVDLPHTTSLSHGDLLELDNGQLIEVHAAPEALLRVKGDIVRLAWHIGNRHSPCQIESDHLLIPADKVLAEMLAQLGANVEPVSAPFTPEGGAYGHGRTLSHAH